MHDRDVAVGSDSAGDDHVEGRPLELIDVGEADPRSPISATRTPPIGPVNGSPASWVDSDAR
jgi:hypothetical protein